MRTALGDRPHVEYLDGMARAKVSPKLTHGLVQAAMARILYRAAKGRGLVATELDVHPNDGDDQRATLVPDVAFISNERLNALPPERREEPPFSPDIAVEVWSPSNDRRYLDRKIARYLATGAELVLDVDPYERTISAHDGATVRIYKGGETFEHSAVDWLGFDVAEAFSDLGD